MAAPSGLLALYLEIYLLVELLFALPRGITVPSVSFRNRYSSSSGRPSTFPGLSRLIIEKIAGYLQCMHAMHSPNSIHSQVLYTPHQYRYKYKGLRRPFFEPLVMTLFDFIASTTLRLLQPMQDIGYKVVPPISSKFHEEKIKKTKIFTSFRDDYLFCRGASLSFGIFNLQGSERREPSTCIFWYRQRFL